MPDQDLELRHLQANLVLEFARIGTVEHRRLGELFAHEGLEGITPGQSRVLMILFQARGGLTAKELSVRMGVSEVTVGRFIKGLCAAGWLARARDPDDRRAWTLTPTDKARTALPAFIRVSNQVLDEVFTGFDSEEIRCLAKVVARLRGNLEAL